MSLLDLPSVGLVEAATDPQLLGSIELWPRQKKLLEDFEAGPEVHIVDWGRRASKTTLGALTATWMAVGRPELRRYLRARERGWAVGLATNQKQARIFVDAAWSLIEESPLYRDVVESRTQEEILFKNGMGIAAFPCTSRSGRGWPIFCLVFDEFAQHIDTEGRSQADEVWGALTPSTAQFGDMARILALSTPAGSQGLFFDLFRRADAGELPGAMAHRATTREVNPLVTEDYLERERARLGEDVYRAEYEAEFTAGGGVFFDRDELRRVTKNRVVLPEEGRGWVAALDPSSGGGDPFALVIVGRDARPGYENRLLVGHVERWLPRRRSTKGGAGRRSREERDLWVDSVLDGVARQVLRFAAVAISDAHIPGVVQAELFKRGVAQVIVRPWTAHGRLAAFQAVRARVATESIEMPADDQLVAELVRVRTRFRGGGPYIEVGRSGDSHGDLAIALAAGVYEIDSQGVLPQRARISRPQVTPPTGPTRLPTTRRLAVVPPVPPEPVEADVESWDLIVEYDGDPASLDETVQALGAAVVVQGAAAPGYEKTADGFYRIRVFGPPDMVAVMIEHQGYVKRVVRREQITRKRSA